MSCSGHNFCVQSQNVSHVSLLPRLVGGNIWRESIPCSRRFSGFFFVHLFRCIANLSPSIDVGILLDAWRTVYCEVKGMKWNKMWITYSIAEQCKPRVFKRCNHAITQLRKIFVNLRKFKTNERQPGKTGKHVVYLPQFNNVF